MSFGADRPSGVASEDGFSFSTPFAMSGDGTTFAGWGLSATGGTVGWVVTVPAPGSLDLLGLGALAGVRRRR